MPSLVLTLPEEIDCGTCDVALLWLHDPTKLAINEGEPANKMQHIIEAAITDITVVDSSNIQYTVQYDSGKLADGVSDLVACDVKKLCCLGCAGTYVKELLPFVVPDDLVYDYPITFELGLDGDGVTGLGKFDPEARTPDSSSGGLDYFDFVLPGDLQLPAPPYAAPSGKKWIIEGSLQLKIVTDTATGMSAPTRVYVKSTLEVGGDGTNGFGFGYNFDSRDFYLAVDTAVDALYSRELTLPGGDAAQSVNLVLKIGLQTTPTDKPEVTISDAVFAFSHRLVEEVA